MYFNVICLKSGKTIPFQSYVPYSVDKISPGWNVITCKNTNQIISVVGSEIASLCSQEIDKLKDSGSDRIDYQAVSRARESRKPGFTHAIEKG